MRNDLTLTYDSKLSDLTRVNESFDSAILRIAYWGSNRNKTYISKEAFENALPSIYNCPVVCNYDREADAIGGHDMVIVKRDDEVTLVNVTKPVGVVPESAKAYWEKVTEDDGAEHEYLCVPVLLWTREEAYDHIKAHGVVAESMEINIKSGSLSDGIYTIDSFEFTAFCLLERSEPCFESASIEMFSISDFKDTFARMMADARSLYAHTADHTEGGVSEMNDEVETRVFEAEEDPAEEQAGEDQTDDIQTTDDETEDVPVSEVKRMTNYELAGHIQGEIFKQLDGITFVNPEWHEVQRQYWLIDIDTDKGVAYIEDRMDCNLYRCNYNIDGDSVSLDLSTKQRVRTVFVDWVEGDRQDYALADPDVYERMSRELNDLRAFKKQTEDEERANAIDTLKAKFSDLADSEKFESIINSGMTIDDMEDKCFALRGRMVNFSKDDKQPLRIPVMPQEQDNEPYGGLFVKYGKIK